ncbi:MAG: hypothetical protein ABIG84_00820 [archaeon]
MEKNMLYSCPLYPCFDTLTGAGFKRNSSGRISFDCASCSFHKNACMDSSDTADSIDTIERLYFKKIALMKPRLHISNEHAGIIISTLKDTPGICNNMHLLSEDEKKEALKIELSDAHQNIGIYSALTRDLSIAFAHNFAFRPPPMPVVLLVKDRIIIGEMTSTGPKFYKDKCDCDYVLPPVPFPEAEPFGIDIVSASPGYLLDTWIRKKIDIRNDDATLILGLNLKR